MRDSHAVGLACLRVAGERVERRALVRHLVPSARAGSRVPSPPMLMDKWEPEGTRSGGQSSCTSRTSDLAGLVEGVLVEREALWSTRPRFPPAVAALTGVRACRGRLDVPAATVVAAGLDDWRTHTQLPAARWRQGRRRASGAGGMTAPGSGTPRDQGPSQPSPSSRRLNDASQGIRPHRRRDCRQLRATRAAGTCEAAR